MLATHLASLVRPLDEPQAGFGTALLLVDSLDH